MSSLKQLVRLHRWNLDEKRQKLNEFEALRERMLSDIAELDRIAENETERAKQGGQAALALPSFISGLVGRRKKLEDTLKEIEISIERARDDLADAFQELKRYELADENEEKRKTQARKRRETQRDDEQGLESFRRRAAAQG